MVSNEVLPDRPSVAALAHRRLDDVLVGFAPLAAWLRHGRAALGGTTRSAYAALAGFCVAAPIAERVHVADGGLQEVTSVFT